MSDWTVKRLDALPAMTVIEWLQCGDGQWALLEEPTNHYGWIVRGVMNRSSEEIVKLADPGSIRVVSVPVDALLSKDAVHSAIQGLTTLSARQAIQAAIAHVTGEDR